MTPVIPVALTANSLLKGLLGTTNAARSSAQPAAPTGEASFASLLAKAREGQVSSGLPVSVRSDAAVKLSPQQLERLSAAADVAEAHGASQALVSIDGRLLTLDVSTREITADVTDQLAQASKSPTPTALAGIDAFVQVPSLRSDAAQAAAATSLTPLAANPPQSASLLAMLAQQSRA